MNPSISTPIDDDGYDADENGRRCYDVAIEALRVEREKARARETQIECGEVSP